MNKMIRITHELIGKAVRSYELTKKDDESYFKEEKRLTKKMIQEFKNIDSISFSYPNAKNPSIIVEGTIHLYGYKLEDGGFFDMLNFEYYSGESTLVKTATIIDRKSTLNFSKVKIKNKM